MFLKAAMFCQLLGEMFKKKGADKQNIKNIKKCWK
jgi:hypothetical protein